MGKKLSESSPEPEPTVPGTLTSSEHKPHKRKKSKNKHKDEDGSGNGSCSHKRKHVETEEVVEEAKKVNKEEKKKKKKKKNKKEREVNGVGENGKMDEEVRDGNVVVSGKGAKDDKYKPIESFGDSNLPEEVIECCKGFKKPSPIQSRAWPFLLDGRDFIGIAATGSGKTLAFGVPAIMHVLRKRNGNMSKGRNPLCLVLSPTRELAQQISDVLVDAGKASGVKSICLYGGTPKDPQRASLKAGIDIVIGTPGRLKDLVEEGVCRLSEISFVAAGSVAIWLVPVTQLNQPRWSESDQCFPLNWSVQSC